jgi:DNA-binding response OmpR family regulator
LGRAISAHFQRIDAAVRLDRIVLCRLRSLMASVSHSRLRHAARAPLVLVLEDEPSLQELMARLLRVHGFESRHGRTVDEAIVAAEREHIDAFILDIGLRGADSGFTMLQWLRRDSRYAQSPVTMVTGQRVLSPEQQHLLRSHRAHVIHKPHPHMTLVNHLKRVVVAREPSTQPEVH